MRRQTRTLIIAGVAVVALAALMAGLLLFTGPAATSSSSATTTTADQSVVIVDKSRDASGNVVTNAVTSVHFDIAGAEQQLDEEGDVVVAYQLAETFDIQANADGNLGVTMYDGLPISSYTVSAAVSAFTTVKATQQAAAGVTDFSPYGLDTVRATAKVTYFDGSVMTFELGGLTPLQDAAYIRVDGGDTVYIMPTSFANTMLTPSLKYIGTTLYDTPAVRSDDTVGQAVVKNCVLTGTARDRAVAFRCTTLADPPDYALSSYVVTQPYADTGDTVKLPALAGGMLSLTADKAVIAHPTAAQKVQYGLDNPQSVAAITVSVKTEVDRAGTDKKDSSFYGDGSYTVSLGSRDDNGNYYAMLAGVDVIYLIPSSNVPWAQTQFLDIASSVLFTRNIKDISSLTVSLDGQTYVMNVAHNSDGSVSAVTIGDQSFDTSNFSLLYEVYMLGGRNGTPENAGSGDPVFTLTITPTDPANPTIVAKYYPASANSYTCHFWTGEQFKITASRMADILRQTRAFLNGQPVKVNTTV